MIFLSAILLGILVGLMLKGRFTNMWNMTLHHAWLLLPWFLIDTFFNSRFSSAIAPQAFRPLVVALLVLQYGLFLLFALINRRQWPLLVIGAGEVLNFLVIMANGGHMPVDTSNLPGSARLDALRAGLIPHYIELSEGTRLAFLCDRIPVRLFTSSLFSAGDVILWFGLFLFMVLKMRTARQGNAHTETTSSQHQNASET